MITTPLRKTHKSLWARLRCKLLEEHGLVCMACGYVPPKVGELEGHEVHSFPGGGVIKLELILLLCRKCHHTIHLERSVFWERDVARWKWADEHRPTDKRQLRSWPTSAALKEMSAVGDAAARAYREEMLNHYCKVNRVTRQRCERDFENAKPPENVMALGRPNPTRRLAQMDYGPFEGELEAVRARAEERLSRREARVLEELDDPEITERWNKMTREERDEYGDPEEFAFWVHADEDCGYEFLPDHEAPWATAMWRDTFGS
jgi:hypothetical protein